MQLWTHQAVDYIIEKTNKRLYSLRVLKQRDDRIPICMIACLLFCAELKLAGIALKRPKNAKKTP